MSSSPGRTGRARPAAGAGGVRDRLGGLFTRAAHRASEGAERLREAAGAGLRPSILQHAQAARERGNLEAAFWLLDEAFRETPEDAEVTFAFWDVALSLGRAPAAAAAGVAIVEASAARGETDAAARHFSVLAEQVPDARVSPAAVARMLPPLCARIVVVQGAEAEAARHLARVALAHALREGEDGRPVLTPGLAVHLFKEARKVDTEAARRTAEIALASPDLHEVKRAELERFLAGEDPGPELAGPALEVDDEGSRAELELDDGSRPALEGDGGASDADIEADVDARFALASDPAPADGAAPRTDAEPVLPPLSQDEVVDAARRLRDRHGPLSTEAPPPPHPEGLQVMRAVPVDFEEQALVLQLPGGRASRVGWKEIQALSVAQIARPDGDPDVVIDCILNWRRRQFERLRLVRFYATDFVPGDIVAGEAPQLSTFLTDLFERCQAAPLPDPESALGVRIAAFDDLEGYQREVLELEG